ncbi:MAG: cyclomaltodextrinase N-terminal domain-containing protein [Cyclobacteriaceae bacterium]
MRKAQLIICLFIQTILSAQSIERIEPQNWWVGMKYNTITLLIYGKDISDLQPELSYKGVQLLKKETVENKNYLFVTLNVKPSALAGVMKINFSKNGKQVLTKDFPLLERSKTAPIEQAILRKMPSI